MNRSYTLLSLGLMLGLSLTCRQKAQAQLTLALDQSTLTAPAGSVLTFSGVITNTTTATVFLNGDQFSPLPTGFSLDDTDFFLNTPLSLAPKASTADLNLFTVTLSSALTSGTSASDTFQIIGGANASAQNVVGSASFTSTAKTAPPSVPEPGAMMISAACGAAGMVFANMRRRKKSVM